MTQFIFLRREWAAVFEAASKAEAAVYTDSRTACFYARRALELAVNWASGQPLRADPRAELQANSRRGGVQQGATAQHTR
jgi:hypothetical protein